MAKANTISAGIDISKSKCDIAVHGACLPLCVANEEAGWQRAAEHLKRAGVTRVGLEASGKYERGITRYLQHAGFTVVMMQPLQVKAFAKLHLKRAKTDTLDAVLIAACTHILDVGNKVPPEARFDALADHLTFIEQIEEDIVRCKTRLEQTTDKRLRRMSEADIKRLRLRRDAELLRLEANLRKYDDLSRRLDLVESIPSIGRRTALCLVIRMPELGRVSREEAAALAGLAPFVRQSGTYEGQAHIGGGRSRVRRTLYAAALPGAFHWNPELKAFYARLRAAGKSHNSALVACARKLLVFANTVVARGTPWEAKTAT